MDLKTGNLEIVEVNKLGVNSSIQFSIDIPMSEFQSYCNPIESVKFIHRNLAYKVCKSINQKIQMNNLGGMLHLVFRQVEIIKRGKVYRIKGCLNIMDKFKEVINNELDMIEPITYAIIAEVTYKKNLQEDWRVKCD